MNELFKGPEICKHCGYEFRDHRVINKACPQNGETRAEYRHWSETQTFEPKKQKGWYYPNQRRQTP